jgi:two-component system, cell cycle sensor histidine kinase and response regulator CckA
VEPAQPVILVVDDDPGVCGLLRMLLERAGYGVQTAQTGADGLARLAAGGISLLILDLMLPDRDGLDLCVEIRAAEATSYLPIIILTARGSADERHAGFAAGADDYLTKPFQLDELLDRVGVWVRTYQRLQALHEQQRREQEHLQQMVKMEAVGRLAGGVAHDFNNLLTVITGFNELLQQRLEPASPLQEFTEQVAKAGEQAATLTSQLLAFGRRQVLAPEVLDVNAIVADMERMLRRLIGEDIELLIALDPALRPVQADPSQFQQIILNLAVNARDAMPRGGTLTIATANVTLDRQYARIHAPVQPGDYVQLTVRDTGQGMDAETQARIFEPFFTTKLKGKGTGLGLATVYGIVKQSGGYIWVDSALDQGTTFTLQFPPAVAESAAEEPPAAALGAVQGTETVLLVEDQDQLRSLLRSVLQAHGYTVLEAARGDEALAIGKEHSGPIHLLVTDVVLPGMNGRELAAALSSARPGVKTVFMSGYPGETLGRYGIVAMDIDFLQKPFPAAALAQKVRQALDAPRAE